MVRLEKNKDNDSVLESKCLKAGVKKCLSGLFPGKHKGGRAMSWKLCTAISALQLVVFISFIIWLSQYPYFCSSSCPHLWVGFEGKCFYFSKEEGNWTSSRDNCFTLDANLAVIQSEEELDFVLRYKGLNDHWIGLSRQNASRQWEWVDGTKFNNSLFSVRGGEDFAFLNDQKVTSARSSGERHWICTKPQDRWKL